jgi:hypothetical protein
MVNRICLLRFALVAIYLSVGVGLLMAFFSNWAYDDPFITYRYAANLATGSGFVYNPDEHVLSTTTPLFTMVLACLSGIWSDIPSLANIIGIVSLLVGAIFLWDLSATWKVPMVGWAGLMLYPTFPLLVTTLGSETPLYLALCLGTFAFYSRESYRMTAVLAAMAFLTRPDGILVAVVLGVDYLARSPYILRRRADIATELQTKVSYKPEIIAGESSQHGWLKVPWVALTIFICLTLPWFIYAWLKFGSPIPATMTAKQFQGSMAISERFATGLTTIARQYSTLWHYWLQAIIAAGGLIYLVGQAQRWLVFISWMVVYFLGYSILGVSRYFWYYAPLVPGFLVLVGLGLEGLSRMGRHGMNRKDETWLKFFCCNYRGWMLPLSIGILSTLFLAQVVHLNRLQAIPDGRYPIYREVGEWLKVHTDPNVKVGTLEGGIIGYYSQRYMIDFAGLIQPEVAAQLSPQTNYEDAALWALKTYQPDYLVLHDGLFRTVEQTYVVDQCALAQHFSGARYGHAFDLSIYACNN